MKRENGNKKALLIVAGLYCACVLLRFILAVTTSAYPMVNIDEFLYYGMARSIAAGKGLMFRGQPANYSYILYSLVLSPVYLLGLEGPALYRALQLWNILIVSLSVFPIYRLAEAFTRDGTRAVQVAAVSMLLPDFMIGQLMMCENVIIPLFFLLVLAAYRYSESGRRQDILLVGALGGLLFSAKPGAVIPAAVTLAFSLGAGLIGRDGRKSLDALFGAAAMGAVIAVFFGLVEMLGGHASVLSIYDVQIAESRHVDVFVRFLGVYPLYFIIACGVGCAVLPFFGFGRLSPAQKALFAELMISLGLMIAGVAWSVNRYEYNANTAHMRYIGMYIPIMYLFSMVPGQAMPARARKQAPVLGVAVVGLTVLLLFVVDVFAGVNQYTVFAENMTLASFIRMFRSGVPAAPVLIAVLCACGAFLYLIWRRREKPLRTAVTAVLAGCMLINNISAYGISRQDTRFENSRQAQELLGDVSETGEILYLCTDATKSSYYGALDAYSRQDIFFVTLNDLFNQMYANAGVYMPFLPKGERGNRPERLTPDTDTLVMDATVYAMLKLSDNTAHRTVNRDSLHLVKILDRTQPWLDCVIGNTTNTILSAGDTGIVLVFQEKYLKSPLTFRMKIFSEEGTSLSFFSGLEEKSVQLEAGMHEYDITFDKPADAYNLKAASGDIRFYGFDLFNA